MSQHHIIVAVDGSETSKQATQWAATLLQDGDDLHLVTVRNRQLLFDRECSHADTELGPAHRSC